MPQHPMPMPTPMPTAQLQPCYAIGCIRLALRHHSLADPRRLVAHHPIHYAHPQVDPYHRLYARDYYPFGREFGFCPAVLVPPSNRVGRVVFLLDGEFVHSCDGLLYRA